jgi:shikimate kinase
MTAVILIGMPGAGKSTIGVLLAKALGLDFVDTDVLIQVREGRTLEAILASDGYLALRDIEATVLRSLDPADKVVATGGSAVYSTAAMAHLKAFGPAVLLDVPLAALHTRVGDLRGRGIAGPPGATLESLAAERLPLYGALADIVVAADLPTADAVVEGICALLVSSHRRRGRSAT